MRSQNRRRLVLASPFPNKQRMQTLPPSSYAPSVTRLDEGVFRGPQTVNQIASAPLTRASPSTFLLTTTPQIVLAANPLRVGLQMQNVDPTNPGFYMFNIQPALSTAFTISAGGSVLYDFSTPTDVVWGFTTAAAGVQLVIVEMSKALPQAQAPAAPGATPNAPAAPYMPPMIGVNYSGGGGGGGGYAGR